MDNTIITILISSVTGIVTFFMGVNKTKKEVEEMSLNNIQKSIDIYNRIINDMKDQIDNLTVEINELKAKVDELTKENHELKQMLSKRK